MRHYYRKVFRLSLLALWSIIVLQGCGPSPSSSFADGAVSPKQVRKMKPPHIEGEDYDKDCGADSYACQGDNPCSDYYQNPDFYSLASDNKLVILPQFKTMQQTTEWSGGNVAALMVLHYFGADDGLTEWDMAVAMRSMIDRNHSSGCSPVDAVPGTADEYAEYGTTLYDMCRFFRLHGKVRLVSSSCRANYTPDDLVKAGDLYPACDRGNLYPSFSSPESFAQWLTIQLFSRRAVIVEWSDWDGHWAVIIGIDNNNTPEFYGDDTLIFAEPYDTSDHWQDGYSIAPLERFFYAWKDRAVAPKPYQLQPYLVVGK